MFTSPDVIIRSMATGAQHNNGFTRGTRGLGDVVLQQTASFLRAATGTRRGTADVPHLLAPSSREVGQVVA